MAVMGKVKAFRVIRALSYKDCVAVALDTNGFQEFVLLHKTITPRSVLYCKK